MGKKASGKKKQRNLTTLKAAPIASAADRGPSVDGSVGEPLPGTPAPAAGAAALAVTAPAGGSSMAHRSDADLPGSATLLAGHETVGDGVTPVAVIKANVVDPTRVATRLNSAAIYLLRRLQREDSKLGLSGARLSALSVLVFGGPRPPGKLADAEGVSAPSMTRLVSAMEADGLVERAPHAEDGRSVVVRATEQGASLLLRGRDQRVVLLAGWLTDLSPEELETLDAAVGLVEAVLLERRSPEAR